MVISNPKNFVHESTKADKLQSPPASFTSSGSGSISSGILISQNDDDSILFSETESQGMAEKVANMRLSEDIPLPSIERGSPDTAGGVNISGGRSHSRTPSVSLSPPLGVSDTGYPPYHEGSRGGSASIDGRLGMLQVGDNIEDIATGSENPSVLLRPERPDACNDTPQKRRRSSSRINLVLHDVADEELPHDRFHEPSFQSAFSDAHRAVSELADVLSSSSLSNVPDSTMRSLCVEAKRLAQFRCQSTRTIGFVGDSGVDFKGLARTSNSGEACTCVATEYHYHNSNNFAIDVEWFSEDDIAAQLSELLQSYRHFHLHEPDLDPREREDLEDRANLAKDTFRAMFRGRLGDEQFLTLSSESVVMETLKSWVAESRISSASNREEQQSINECSTHLMRLTSEESSNQQPAKWPFIRKIKLVILVWLPFDFVNISRVFLKAHILSKGLVLVDLPGLRDLNSARRNITERYMLQCDEIFAICNIGRAMTDASVVSIFDLARQARLSNVGIICTKSDDIQAEEAIRDWRGERARRIKHFMDTIATDQRDVESIQEDLADYAADDDISEGEAKEVFALNRRSERAKQTLDNLYRNRVLGNLFQVFCASNTEYWKHRYSPKDAAFPHLSLSGILAIRKHCISMVADRQLRVATKYIQDDIPALLEDVELWVQSGAGSVDAEQKAAIRETLNMLEARLNRILAQRVAEWTRAASDASGIWAATYSAFCRGFGDHYTGTVGGHNWNEEAIEHMVGDLGIPWETLKSTLCRDLEGREDRIQQLMDWVIEYLDTELPDSSQSASTLKRAMSSRQHLLLADVEQTFEKFNTDLSMLRTLALSGLRTSIIGQLMEASYQACINEGGRGSDARRKAIINRKLTDEATFKSLQVRMRISFNATVDNFQDDIQTAVAEHLAVIKNTLDIVRSDNIALESEREPEFRVRVERIVGVVRGEIRRIQEAISL
ncbi:hypothetical protein LSUB1_G006630 [Lachnellula subtilissima]|uniref:Nuclear GTPase SLIP-GC n=1 Tax=Lachnellula subtilissima TaxID=602034 RepID=A0A8H8RD15_9HELO|nr:hypothetical protein LSUB1_G006630 [Lachnellula subtilissima]